MDRKINGIAGQKKLAPVSDQTPIRAADTSTTSARCPPKRPRRRRRSSPSGRPSPCRCAEPPCPRPGAHGPRPVARFDGAGRSGLPGLTGGQVGHERVELVAVLRRVDVASRSSPSEMSSRPSPTASRTIWANSSRSASDARVRAADPPGRTGWSVCCSWLVSLVWPTYAEGGYVQARASSGRRRRFAGDNRATPGGDCRRRAVLPARYPGYASRRRVRCRSSPTVARVEPTAAPTDASPEPWWARSPAGPPQRRVHGAGRRRHPGHRLHRWPPRTRRTDGRWTPPGTGCSCSPAAALVPRRAYPVPLAGRSRSAPPRPTSPPASRAVRSSWPRWSRSSRRPTRVTSGADLDAHRRGVRRLRRVRAPPGRAG